MNREQETGERETKGRRAPVKSDFDAVLKAATKPLKKERGEKEPEETSESRHADDST